MKSTRSQRGVTLIETALSLVILLVVANALFDFGRIYHIYEVTANAAREGARFSVAPAPGTTVLPSNDAVVARVQDFLVTSGVKPEDVNIVVSQANTINVDNVAMTYTTVHLETPYDFMWLPLTPVTIRAEATMRNETN